MITQFERVLVTGGAGCIGMQVCRELSQRGIAVQLFDLPEQISIVQDQIGDDVSIYFGSILDKSSLRDSMADCDAVIHLAAYLGVRRTETNRLRCFEINIDGTKNIFETAVQQNIKKIVFASSSEVYGEPSDNPITEDFITQGKTVYAVTKLAGEELCKAYTQRYPNMSYSILRYFNTYGPYQMAQFIVPRFIKGALQGETLVINGDGEQLRSYCYSTDTAFATVEALLRSEASNKTINVGNGDSLISVNDLAKLIIKLTDKEGKIDIRNELEFNNTDRHKDREIHNRYCKADKAYELLDFKPKISLEEGLSNVIKGGVIPAKWATTDLSYTIDDSL